jgi:signal transduction histidine kinase
MARSFDQLLDRLLKPHRRVSDPEHVQRSRLLSAVLLVQIVALAMILTFVLRLHPQDIHDPAVQGGALLGVLMAAMYALSRRGHTKIAVLGVIVPYVVAIHVLCYSGADPIFAAFLMVPIILAAMFFSLLWTAVASAAILASAAVLLSFVDPSVSGTPYWNLRNMLFFLAMGTGLVLTSMWHLGRLERIRQRELRRVNEQLEAQLAELERFTYTVSHELKAPIVTIKGYLGSVERPVREGCPPEVQADFDRISKAADKMHATLADLLELSRVGRVVNPPAAVALEEVAGEALSALDERISARGIEVSVSSDLPVVHGDRVTLREVLQNLVENAAKYMGEQKSPRIEIGWRTDGREPVFFVRDNGIGIEPRYHAKVFGLFERLDSASEGTGVGLALARRIVEMHGGRMWVESEGPRRGSTFCFTIPDRRPG